MVRDWSLFLRWGCINKLDLSTLTDSSVGRCNIAFLRGQNQSPLADCGFSSENCWSFLLFYAFLHDCECICACMCLCVYVHASSPLRATSAYSVNRVRTHGARALWSVQIGWITGDLFLNQVRQIAYRGGERMQQQQQAVTFGTVTVQWSTPWIWKKW